MFEDKKLLNTIESLNAAIKSLQSNQKMFVDEYNKIAKELESIRTIAFPQVKEYTDKAIIEVKDSVEKLRDEEIAKFLSNIEKMFQFNKEISLMAVLSKSDVNMTALKRDLVMPHVAHSWAENDKRQASDMESKAGSKGQMLLRKERELKDKKLVLEREGKDASVVNGQLEILKLLLEK